MIETIKIPVNRNTLNAIRYAAYSQTSEYFVLISAPDENGDIEISFSPKRPQPAFNFTEQFFQALRDEKIREKSASENAAAAKLILHDVFKRNKPVLQDIPEEEKSAGSLTPEQEEELDALIAEVEKELQAEMKDIGRDEDPQNINKTWEEMNKDAK